ncbi:MAG: hypothetical protein M1813_001856 [Trichoglossum hirsutum]|nr:MAG: hypothetical protein M1813_001856 [Trichoglossum hirsutum]
MPYHAIPARVFHFPNNFRTEQSDFIMWHHHHGHDPSKIQLRLKKTFPGLYPKDTDLTTAIQGHIKMHESKWAPSSWLNMDKSNVPWGWMLLVEDEDMILEGGICRGNLDVQSGDMVLDVGDSAEVCEVKYKDKHEGSYGDDMVLGVGGSAEVYEVKCSEDKHERSYGGGGQHSDAQANSGENKSVRDGNCFLGGDNGSPKIEPLIDISETDPKSNEGGIPAYFEVHLEELMDCFTPANTNR